MLEEDEKRLREDARLVLRSLLWGLDPETGQDLDANDVVNRPIVLRALLLGVEALSGGTDLGTVLKSEIAHSAGTPRTKKPERAGQGWTQLEDDELRTLFEQRRTLRSIASELARTTGAIAARLVQLKLVKERDEARRLLDYGRRVDH